MAEKKRRVAIVLELDAGYKRHTDVFAGTQLFADECGTWKCIIDEFADYRLLPNGDGQIPYDGIIARASKQLAERAARCGIPLVNVWINSPAEAVPSVFPALEAEGRIAAKHLLERGLRSFACLRSKGDKAQDLEERGFVDCLSEAGFECGVTRPFENVGPESPDQWMRLEQTLAEHIDGWSPPVGVYLLIDSHARILVQMCEDRGLRVPEDVAIVINDNEDQFCNNPPPSLTSIEPGYKKVGYEAAALLDRMMDGEPAPKGPILTPPTGLVVRQSTDFFAVDDELVARALQFIAANIQKPIGVDDVAEAAFTSLSTLQNRFREHLGRSIFAEIRRLRIERAKRHLTESKQRIVDIAKEVGFGDQHRMNEVFRRELGMTPSAYRKKHTR